MSDPVVTFPHPLERFYLTPHGGSWSAWQHSRGVGPDYLLGRFDTEAEARAAVQAKEDSERERYGVWRFFSDD